MLVNNPRTNPQKETRLNIESIQIEGFIYTTVQYILKANVIDIFKTENSQASIKVKCFCNFSLYMGAMVTTIRVCGDECCLYRRNVSAEMPTSEVYL